MTPKIDSIESDRLHLEIRRESHAAELFKPLCEKEIYRYMIRDVPESIRWLAEGFRQLETLVSSDGKEIYLGWIGRDKTSKAPVGIFEITISSDEAFIAYTILKEHWGQGYAAEATQAVIKYVGENYHIKRFVLEMDTRNRGSVRVAEKLDFDFVKVTDNACFLKNFVSHEFQFQKML